MAPETRSYDKDRWARGPWDQEPDRVDFEHVGLPCLLLRNNMGAWCGYAAVFPGHPWYGIGYNQCTVGDAPEPVIEDIDARYPVTDDMPEHTRRFALKMREHAREAEARGGFMSTQWLKEHPRYSCYEHSPEALIEVHGGLTYADACSGPICHEAKPGQPDQVWWFGFDCSHAGDLTPGLEALYSTSPNFSFRANVPEELRDVYRDVNYVRAETMRLAEQLAAIAPPPAHPTRRIDLEEA